MMQYKFKTNINCSGCVAKVTPVLNGYPDIKEWTVDTINPAKLLTVETEHLEEEVQSLVLKAGFRAEKMRQL